MSKVVFKFYAAFFFLFFFLMTFEIGEVLCKRLFSPFAQFYESRLLYSNLEQCGQAERRRLSKQRFSKANYSSIMQILLRGSYNSWFENSVLFANATKQKHDVVIFIKHSLVTRTAI